MSGAGESRIARPTRRGAREYAFNNCRGAALRIITDIESILIPETPMSALICGSFAFDTIMVFHDHFKNHILPDKVHILNVSFLVPQLRREFGGGAGNIAYGLKMLGGEPLPMGTVGKDFAPYAGWMNECGIALDHITVVEDAYTAQAYITTDMDDNQITAFHPGAMSYARENRVAAAQGVALGIV